MQYCSMVIISHHPQIMLLGEEEYPGGMVSNGFSRVILTI
jgi:hypothetical protein